MNLLFEYFSGRPVQDIGVRVGPVAQHNFFCTALDPLQWRVVVFWKENSGHQPQLIRPENEGGDETSYRSPPSNFHSFDDPDVPFGPQGPPSPEPPAPHGLKLLRHLVMERG